MTGNDKWPGDLWGVDDHGDLLIIEGKYARTSDPFKDFDKFYHPNRTEFLSKTIRERLQKRYDAELKYEDNGYDIRAEGKTLGILPRSSKRVYLRRWKTLTQGIDGAIRSAQYPEKVNSFLSTREE